MGTQQMTHFESENRKFNVIKQIIAKYNVVDKVVFESNTRNRK